MLSKEKGLILRLGWKICKKNLENLVIFRKYESDKINLHPCFAQETIEANYKNLKGPKLENLSGNIQ